MSSHTHISLNIRSLTILSLFSSYSALKYLLFFFALSASAASSASWSSSFRYSSGTSALHRSVLVRRFSRWLTFFMCFSPGFIVDVSKYVYAN